MNWLREHMKQIIWITVGAFILTIFASWGMGGFGGRAPEQNLAEINGVTISLDRFQEAVNFVREEFREERRAPLTDEELNEVREEAFLRLVNESLLQQAAQAQGAHATDRELRQFVASQFRDEEGMIDHQQFEMFLRTLGPFQRESIERQERQRLESFRFQNWLQSQISLTDNEFEEALNSGLREAELYGIYINPRKFIDEALVREFYETNLNDYLSPPEANLSHIKLAGPDPEIEGAERTAQLEQVREIRERIERQFRVGVEFAELAAEYSIDTPTAEQGGNLGWVKPEDLPEELSRVAFNLEAGELSTLIPAAGYYYMLYLEEPIVEEPLPFEEIKDSIQERLLENSHWELAKEKADTLYQQITASESPGETLQELASRSHGYTARTAGYYGWIPIRYVPFHIIAELDNGWAEELLYPPVGDHLMYRIPSEISAAILDLKARDKVVSEPLRTAHGYHLVSSSRLREGQRDQLSIAEERSFEDFLRFNKLQQYVESWLNWERQNAEIKLLVSEDRIGGRPVEEFILKGLSDNMNPDHLAPE